MDRTSDVITLIRQLLTRFSDAKNEFLPLVNEYQLRKSKGLIEEMPAGHTDITIEDLETAIAAIADSIGDMTQDQLNAVILVRQ